MLLLTGCKDILCSTLLSVLCVRKVVVACEIKFPDATRAVGSTFKAKLMIIKLFKNSLYFKRATNKAKRYPSNQHSHEDCNTNKPTPEVEFPKPTRCITQIIKQSEKDKIFYQTNSSIEDEIKKSNLTKEAGIT